jgi:hypothetical protein
MPVMNAYTTGTQPNIDNGAINQSNTAIDQSINRSIQQPIQQSSNPPEKHAENHG